MIDELRWGEWRTDDSLGEHITLFVGARVWVVYRRHPEGESDWRWHLARYRDGRIGSGSVSLTSQDAEIAMANARRKVLRPAYREESDAHFPVD